MSSTLCILKMLERHWHEIPTSALDLCSSMIFYVYPTCVCWILVLVVVVLLHWCHGLREYRWQHAGQDHGWGPAFAGRVSGPFFIFISSQRHHFHIFSPLFLQDSCTSCTVTQIPRRPGKSRCWCLCLCIMPTACSKEGRDVDRFWGRILKLLGTFWGKRLPHYRSATVMNSRESKRVQYDQCVSEP